MFLVCSELCIDWGENGKNDILPIFLQLKILNFMRIQCIGLALKAPIVLPDFYEFLEFLFTGLIEIQVHIVDIRIDFIHFKSEFIVRELLGYMKINFFFNFIRDIHCSLIRLIEDVQFFFLWLKICLFNNGLSVDWLVILRFLMNDLSSLPPIHFGW